MRRIAFVLSLTCLAGILGATAAQAATAVGTDPCQITGVSTTMTATQRTATAGFACDSSVVPLDAVGVVELKICLQKKVPGGWLRVGSCTIKRSLTYRSSAVEARLEHDCNPRLSCLAERLRAKVTGKLILIEGTTRQVIDQDLATRAQWDLQAELFSRT